MSAPATEARGRMAEVRILCPICHKPNSRTTENFRTAKFCQHCGRDVVLNNVVAGSPRYYITRVIKEGGQGAVYEAINDEQKVVAVKEMLDRFTDPKERAEAIERFKEEADMLVRLEATSGRIEARFPWFMKKTAPVPPAIGAGRAIGS